MTAEVPTVLVVDDDDDIREVTRLSLQVFAGWNAVEASSGPAALALAREGRFDAVLLDMMMPGMDGLTTLGRLKADAATRALPVILLTAKSEVGVRHPWHDQPIEGVIAKPFSAAGLAKQVATILRWPLPRPASTTRSGS